MFEKNIDKHLFVMYNTEYKQEHLFYVVMD